MAAILTSYFMRLASNEVMPGLPWWGVRGGGLDPLVLKKTVHRGSPGRVLKFGQVLVNVFRKRFARGREHSSDLMIKRVFSNLFFVRHQNLFPQNSCILLIKSIKTLQINCYIFSARFLQRGGQCRINASPKCGPPGKGEGICRGPTILLHKTHN